MGKRKARKSKASGPRPLISLCMIAKDEAHIIAQCLESVRGLVDEIILVDTGSSDQTMEIAKSFGAKIFHRPWDNDFSKPRNLSLSKATGEWILVLDADEALDESDHERLRALTSKPNHCYSLTQRHYTNTLHLSDFQPARGENPQWERDIAGYFDSKLVRLFPNRRGIEYRGVVHELVEHSISDRPALNIVDPKILIHHYGHLLTPEQEKKKHDLYTALGQAKTREEPGSWKGFFEMAVQSQVNFDFPTAIENFQKAVRLNPTYVVSWVNLGYVLGETARYEEAKQALNTALQLDPKAIEAWCNLGVVHMRTQTYMEAAKCFLRGLDLSRQHVNCWCNLGETFLHLKMLDKAVESFGMVLKLMPKSARAKEGLGNCFLILGRLQDAERWFAEAIKDDPARSKSYYALGQIYRLSDRVQEAVHCLEKFCETESRSPRGDEGAVKIARSQTEVLKRFL